MIEFLLQSEGAARFLDICNRPDVLPWVREPPYVPLTMAVIPSGTRIFVTQNGGSIAVWRGGCIYEVHTAFVPEAHGALALDIGHELVRRLFADGAGAVYTMVPQHNLTARRMAREMSLQFIGAVGTWRTLTGLVPQRMYAADRLTWRGWKRAPKCL